MSRFLLLSLCLSASLFAEDFILRNEGVLIDKGAAKINEMCSELKAKTGVSVYIAALEKLEPDETIGAYAKRLAADLSAPYALLAISQKDRQIEAIVSADLQAVIDKDDILCIMPGCPIIPLLAEYRKDLNSSQQISAGVFNGAAYIVDTIASERGVTLESSVGSGSKTFGVSLTWVVRIMIALTLVAMFVAWRRGKTEGK
jgi:hypothetical protein